MRKLRGVNLNVAAYITPQIIYAVLSIAGVLIGFWVKQTLAKNSAEEATKKRQGAEESAASDFEQKAANETGAVNASIDKQNKSADDWSKQD